MYHAFENNTKRVKFWYCIFGKYVTKLSYNIKNVCLGFLMVLLFVCCGNPSKEVNWVMHAYNLQKQRDKNELAILRVVRISNT